MSAILNSVARFGEAVEQIDGVIHCCSLLRLVYCVWFAAAIACKIPLSQPVWWMSLQRLLIPDG
ncbi:MAG: hypothetical protein F6K16_34860 [Symploca sp. SIO2B6]|nr:hypothetical protein [Symploca sp. SIO2B6]